jgi:hypothetical protein
MINAVGISHVYVEEQHKVGEVVVDDHKSNIVKREEIKNPAVKRGFSIDDLLITSCRPCRREALREHLSSQGPQKRLLQW